MVGRWMVGGMRRWRSAKRQSDQLFQSFPFKTAVILGLLPFQTAVIFMEKMWVGDDFRGVVWVGILKR